MKKLLLLLVLVLLLSVLGISFYILSQPPKEKLSEEFKEKAITELLGRKAQLEDNALQGETSYDGKYIKFDYPSKALVYKFRETSTTSTSSTIEDFSFDIKQPKLVFNMTVRPNDSNISSIDDLPAVKLREARIYEYKKSIFEIDRVSGVAYFKKETGAEKSGFVLSTDKVYSFSITGVEAEEVEKLFDRVISTSTFE